MIFHSNSLPANGFSGTTIKTACLCAWCGWLRLIFCFWVLLVCEDISLCGVEVHSTIFGTEFV